VLDEEWKSILKGENDLIWALPDEAKYLNPELLPFDVDKYKKHQHFEVKKPITFDLDLSGSLPASVEPLQNSSPVLLRTQSDVKPKPISTPRVASNPSLPPKSLNKASFGPKKIQVLSHAEMDQIMQPKKIGKLTDEEKKEKADAKKVKQETKLKKDEDRASKKQRGNDFPDDQIQGQTSESFPMHPSGLPMLPLQSPGGGMMPNFYPGNFDPHLQRLEAQKAMFSQYQNVPMENVPRQPNMNSFVPQNVPHNQSNMPFIQNMSAMNLPQQGNMNFPMQMPMAQIPGIPPQFLAQMPMNWPAGMQMPQMHPQFIQNQQQFQQQQFHHNLMQLSSAAQPNMAVLQNLQNNLQSDDSLSRIIGEANALTPENRAFIEKFLRGDGMHFL
jgi:hypothetical protein